MLLALVGAMLIMGLALVATTPPPRAGSGATLPAGLGSSLILMNIAYVAIMVFVYWTTKGLFNAFGFRRADVPLRLLMIVLPVNLLLLLASGGNIAPVPGGSEAAAAEGSGIPDILSTMLLLALMVGWIWFSVGALRFGDHVGSKLWQAVGIVYLVATAFLVIGVALIAAGGGPLLLLILPLGGLALLGGWICHGIGLIVGAGEMQRS